MEKKNTRSDQVVLGTGQFNLDEIEVASSLHASKIKEEYSVGKAGISFRELNIQGGKGQRSRKQKGEWEWVWTCSDTPTSKRKPRGKDISQANTGRHRVVPTHDSPE